MENCDELNTATAGQARNEEKLAVAPVHATIQGQHDKHKEEDALAHDITGVGSPK